MDDDMGWGSWFWCYCGRKYVGYFRRKGVGVEEVIKVFLRNGMEC